MFIRAQKELVKRFSTKKIMFSKKIARRSREIYFGPQAPASKFNN